MTYGFTLDSIDKVGVRTAEFNFAWSADMDSVVNDYTNGTLQVDAKTILTNLENLKSRANDVIRKL